MPYKDPEQQKLAQQASYRKNRKAAIERMEVRRNERRVVVSQYKVERGCVDCGYSRFAGCLEAHHSNSDKESGIARMMLDARPIALILQELAKCEIICNRCHRERHIILGNFGKNPATLV